jgi:hypothetical protein
LRALAILLCCFAAPENFAVKIPNLSFSFFNPKYGQNIEATDGWISARRDEMVNFRVLLEVENVEAPYEFLIIRDSEGPDPMLVGNKRPQNVWLSVFRLDSAGKRTEVPVLIHCSGGGKNLRVYESMLSLRILYSEPERTRRVESMIDRILASQGGSRSDDPDTLVKQRETFRRMAYQHGVDMPPGEYEVEAKYAPNIDGMWKGTLIAKAKIRVAEENDPLKKALDAKQDN